MSVPPSVIAPLARVRPVSPVRFPLIFVLSSKLICPELESILINPVLFPPIVSVWFFVVWRIHAASKVKPAEEEALPSFFIVNLVTPPEDAVNMSWFSI